MLIAIGFALCAGSLALSAYFCATARRTRAWIIYSILAVVFLSPVLWFFLSYSLYPRPNGLGAAILTFFITGPWAAGWLLGFPIGLIFRIDLNAARK